jgi:hypothetical protein
LVASVICWNERLNLSTEKYTVYYLFESNFCFIQLIAWAKNISCADRNVFLINFLIPPIQESRWDVCIVWLLSSGSVFAWLSYHVPGTTRIVSDIVVPFNGVLYISYYWIACLRIARFCWWGKTMYLVIFLWHQASTCHLLTSKWLPDYFNGTSVNI